MQRLHEKDDLTALPQKLASRHSMLSRLHAFTSASEEAAQAFIEFALTLPVLLLVVTGICAFGIAMNNYLELTNAVDTGARSLAISRGQTTDPCASTATVIYNAAPLLRRANYSFSFVINGTSYPNTASCNAGTANLIQGAPAQVTVTYPCSLIVYGANYAPSCTLKAQTTELIQ